MVTVDPSKPGAHHKKFASRTCQKRAFGRRRYAREQRATRSDRGTTNQAKTADLLAENASISISHLAAQARHSDVALSALAMRLRRQP